MGTGENKELKRKSLTGFIWRVSQNISAQIITLVIQIILARILTPEDYGLVALTSVIITLLSVFVQTGFTSAIVQKKDLLEIDKSTMFFFSIGVGLILYSILFVSAPSLANYYHEPLLPSVFRAQTFSMVIASFGAVHNALIARELLFKKNFISNLISVIVQGVAGISLALGGFGVWALVISTLVRDVVNCIIVFWIYKWVPQLVFSFKSIKKMLSFSVMILAGNLLNSIYNSCRTLVIGKIYNAQMIAYYNKGYNFPATIMVGIDGAMTTVLFSSLSKLQDEQDKYVRYLRKSMQVSITIICPILCGMAAVADPMIRLLLTDKWEEAIPFVMISCLICLSWPLSAKAHALNAIGKSAINLGINFMVKIVAVALVFLSIPYGVYAMCLSGLIDTMISVIAYTYVIAKYCNYSVKTQFFDVLPIYAVGFIMFGAVYALSNILVMGNLLKLMVLISSGILLYAGLSFVFKLEGFMYIWSLLKANRGMLKNDKKK